MSDRETWPLVDLRDYEAYLDKVGRPAGSVLEVSISLGGEGDEGVTVSFPRADASDRGILIGHAIDLLHEHLRRSTGSAS
jgi:hypothetical protein